MNEHKLFERSEERGVVVDRKTGLCRVNGFGERGGMKGEGKVD